MRWASTHYSQWGYWFAWYPVRVDPWTMVWWEHVQRRGTRPMSMGIHWEYR